MIRVTGDTVSSFQRVHESMPDIENMDPEHLEDPEGLKVCGSDSMDVFTADDIFFAMLLFVIVESGLTKKRFKHIKWT